MKKRITSLLGLLLVASVLFSCHSKEKTDLKSKQVKKNLMVDFHVVKPAPLSQIINISGTLKPFEETVLMPEIGGRVVEIHLPEGKPVRKGALLVKLFDGDLQASLKKLTTQLSIAEQTEKRQSELIKVSGISQQDYDQSVLQVHSIRNDIEIIKVQIGKTEIRAPYDGEIGLRNISVGAQVSTTTALATIRELNRMKLDFSVPEKYSSKITEGLKIIFSVQGDETKHNAVVLASEHSVDALTRNLKARALVDNSHAHLVPGAYANVELVMGENKNAIMIPTQAIIPQEKNKKVVVSDQGKAKFVVVKTGIRQFANIEISEGLQEGDTVVTTGLLFLKPGDALKFAKKQKK